MVAGKTAVLDRVHDPVQAQANFMQQLAHDHRDFGRVDAVGAIKRAAAAFRALVGIIEKFLDNIHAPASCANASAKYLAQHGVIAPVKRTKKFGAQNRHILWIVGAEEKLALVRAGAAAHADIHEQLKGTVLLQPVCKGITKDFFPVLWEIPVFSRWIPFMGMGHVQKLHGIHLCGIAVASGDELGLGVKPVPGREGRAAGYEHLRRW